jgi:hypothetical protein
MDSVSCPNDDFCVAVDNGGDAFTYNGSSWSSPSDIDGTLHLSSVSCPSASFCVALDFSDALIYNGSSWSSPAEIDEGNGLDSVSCPSASFCAAVDEFGNALTYTAAGPTITAVSPDTGPTTGGTAITITGTNLTGATSVVVAGDAATDVTVVSSTKITATTPAYSSAGLHYVRVTTPSGESADSTGSEFTYTA